ncbi:hypothetical protein [Microbacterium sp.]|uniref:hypothetical protein n=1 Tax=Microbacterium sp. TaxID=51671 RepID=UPI001ACD0F45|nr:hypothetical protein [Microbacterium sp.]MBN9194006.1 hypothetical protein [Microbacterium sp.]
MTDASTDAAVDTRREQVAAANRRFGAVLSVIGGVLAAVALVALVAGGLLLTWLASAPPGIDDDTADGLRGTATFALSSAPGVLALFAMCGLIAGEQMRGGRIGRNEAAHSRARSASRGLPAASFVSRFRVLPTGWHALWIVVGLAISVLLVAVPVSSWFTGGWPTSIDDEDAFDVYWVIYGGIAFAVTVAAAASLLKKLAYRRAVARGLTSHDGPARGQRFWRWFDYRWRFDLWLAGLGGLTLVLALTPLRGAVGPDASGADLAAALPGVLTFVAIGILVTATGVVCSLNYWRAGEELGTGESAA